MGDVSYTNSVDIWAFGLVLEEMGCGRASFCSASSQVDILFQQFSRFGAPEALRKLPLWRSSFPTMKGTPAVCMKLPASGNAKVLQRALQSDPAQRASAGQLLAEVGLWEFGKLSLLTAGGRQCFEGDRGEFSVLVGTLHPNVLAWLQGCQEELVTLAQQAVLPADDTFQERVGNQLVKGEIFLKTVGRELGTLNGKKLRQEMPARVRRFVSVFKDLNSHIFSGFTRVLQRLIRANGPAPTDGNAKAFLEEDAAAWWAASGSLQFMRGTDRKDNRHIDGGAGSLHMAVSLFGSRLG